MTHVFYEITEDYSVEQMFALVNDVGSYPLFVPDCTAAGFLYQQDNQSVAFVEVEKLGFKKRFTTRNSLDAPRSIEMVLVEGPFNSLIGKWSFIAISEHRCKITFDLNFEFKSKLLDIAFTPIFKELMGNMVTAFTKRAKQVYAK